MLRQIKSDKAIFLRRKRRNRFNLARNNKRSLPRLTVFRSNVHIYAQIIDDINQKVLAEASTVGKEMNSLLKKKTSNIEAAKVVGKKIAERALAVNIKEVVFDRGGYIFHGRVKALADTVRENGLKL